MKNKVLLLLLILSAGLHAQTNDQGSFTLPQAIDFALKNGYSVKNAATDIEIAKKKVAEIRGIGIPQLKTEASFQDFVEVPVSIISANAFNPLGSRISASSTRSPPTKSRILRAF